MSELKACPLCKHEAMGVTFVNGRATSARCGNRLILCDLSRKGLKIDVTEWNSRPIEDALRARIAELEGALKKITEMDPGEHEPDFDMRGCMNSESCTTCDEMIYKVGAWVWWKGASDIGYASGYMKITGISNEIIDCDAIQGIPIAQNQLSEARLRPWTKEEMKQKVGKTFDAEKDSYLATGFVYEKIMLATGGEPTLYTAEGLISMQFTIDGSPCGVLERREGEGWVR